MANCAALLKIEKKKSNAELKKTKHRHENEIDSEETDTLTKKTITIRIEKLVNSGWSVSVWSILLADIVLQENRFHLSLCTNQFL